MRRCLVVLLGLQTLSFGQQTNVPFTSGEGGGSLAERLWLSGQANIVNQSHPGFDAKYSGPNSFHDYAEQKTTSVITLYTGFSLAKNTEFFFDVESSHGAGVSGALGLGGLPNFDAVTDSSSAPYIARAQVRQIIRLGRENEEAIRNPLGLASRVPSKRLEIRIGKMAVTDFFDLNSIGNDSHLQFLNYAIDNNAAYDYAANPRGYTYGALFELYHPGWAGRFGEMFEPNESGSGTDWNLNKGHSENYEFEFHHSLIRKRSGILRLLAFVNHDAMGSYPEAVSAYVSGQDEKPDLSAHIKPGQMNYGFGINGEQEVSDSLRLFGRYGWNEGKREAFQFAETDRTLTLGGDLGGKKWHRSDDRIGMALAVNALTAIHRSYLELWGVSYLLGDGGLNYSREKVLECYYNFRLWRGIFLAFDVQHIRNPAYNSDRGPVWVFGARLHLEGGLHFNY